MANPLASVSELLQQFAKGKGFMLPYMTHQPGAITVVGGGFYSPIPHFNNIGTTIASGIFQTLLVPTSVPANMLLDCVLNEMDKNTAQGMIAGWIYKLGTLNPAATGDQFTHDGATFPVLRKQFNQANKPVTLHPLLYVTTALTGVAPVMKIKNGAGTQGYVNQVGTTVVGTRDYTFAAAAARESGGMLTLEKGDSGVRDIQQINLSVAASAGAITVFGFEPIAPLGSTGQVAGNATVFDAIAGALRPHFMEPAVATSGSATAYFVVMGLPSNTAVIGGWMFGALAS